MLVLGLVITISKYRGIPNRALPEEIPWQYAGGIQSPRLWASLKQKMQQFAKEMEHSEQMKVRPAVLKEKKDA